MRQKYRWTISDPDEGAAAELAAALDVPPLVGRLLAARGWTDPAEARRFLEAGPQQFHDPFGMKGMREAVARIRQALDAGEYIRVYGDYDADGVTSTALMTRLLRRLGARFDTYIPHRSREGYGLNAGAIDLAAEAGVKLLITVDNGISAVEQIAYARELGIDVVVTDHHEAPPVLPDAAVALVNPKQPDCTYPFKGLSGAGVAFKLAHALIGEPDLSLSDLAAIGIVADLMPLTDENRAIVKLGLAEMNRRPSPGIRALAAICGAEPGRLSSGRIAFGLAPRLNAGGRLAEADGAVRLLVAEDDEEAERLALALDQLNRERQQLVDETVVEAEAAWQRRIAENGGVPLPVIVLAGDGWNAGIAGLVASKLVERHYRPTVVLAHDPETGKCKGSARSIDGFDLYAALRECADEMEHFGGHQAAAGMTIRRDKVEALEAKLGALAAAWLTAEDWTPKKKADLRCQAAELTLEAAEQLSALEPYGNGNPTPRLVLREASVADAKAMGKEGKHLRALLAQGGRRLEAVGFGFGEEAARLIGSGAVDVLGELAINEWNGSRRVQFMLQDWRPAALPVLDRRQERDWTKALRLLADAPGPLLVLGASTQALARLESAAIALHGAALYVDGSRLAAGRVPADGAPDESPYARRHAGGVRLALVGLPDGADALDGLACAMRDCGPLEEIHLFADDSRDASGDGADFVFPTREQFGQVYALFRRQAEWIDAPDGFLRQVADRTGWPLAAVRLMQEIFDELGFIRRHRASVQVVANPPRRALDESERYRKAQRRAEAAALAGMSFSKLQAWLRQLANA
ncbi:single-stranded-DNA-specific exonuclease RecJ [Cohnella sp. REN36]|uniref:single-stranded-DNA-specific exonuclease RecJ n=1 Tax=Cohnella sp. REN36 TaxID=2887347 RepID=UPI001D1559F3|nr:single-stranded-DNA-specific exonuclease RecJ [Cohnella sp. REN36]MCC3376942.1 single-stranded-DNA-specific exonuclease RecJ [Cohnella sp. REN36]